MRASYVSDLPISNSRSPRRSCEMPRLFRYMHVKRCQLGKSSRYRDAVRVYSKRMN
uniref:Uncharacterized protein n=1 Tax=Parascaris equorum TaxID=6256 RepID=A0A914RGP2_PAREQ